MHHVTCTWDEACLQPHKALGLCRRHHQLASRRGVIDRFRKQSVCVQCAGPLPSGSRSNRTYCSRRCTNLAAYGQRDAGERLAAHKAWRERTAPQRRARLLAARTQRFCAWCGLPLPIDCGNRRRFCDRRCSNKWSLHNSRESRYLATHQYRSRKRNEAFRVTVGDWRSLCERYRNRCAYCARREPLTMDHIVPLIRGGRHAIGNLVPVCQSCNSSKRDALLIEWRFGRRRTRASGRIYTV